MHVLKFLKARANVGLLAALYQSRVLVLVSALLVFASLIVGGCGVYVPRTVSLWADVHPQGWVVFTGSRAPFPPPQKPQDLTSKILLFHPALGVTLSVIEDPSEDLSWPRWGADDALYVIGDSRKIYRIPMNFDDIERLVYDPSLLLQLKPLSLHNTQRLWADFKGSISALAPSPHGRYMAFLRESRGYDSQQFTVVILDLEQDPQRWPYLDTLCIQ